jgi:hypothetical protein
MAAGIHPVLEKFEYLTVELLVVDISGRKNRFNLFTFIGYSQPVYGPCHGDYYN